MNGTTRDLDAGSPLGSALRSCRRHFIAAGVFSCLINLLYLAPTLYMLLVYDRVVPTGSLETLGYVSAVCLVAVATLSLLEWLRSRIMVRASAQLERELAGPVMSAVLVQPSLSRTERAQSMRQYDTFRQAISGGAILAAFDAPWTPIYVIAAFLLNPALGLLSVCAAGLILGLAWLNERATHGPLKAANEAAAVAYGRQDYASAWAAEIRALGMGRAIVANQLQDRAALVGLQVSASFAAGRYSALIKFSRLVLQSAALGFGAYLAVERQISAGAIIAVSLLLTRALAPIEQIVGSWRSIVGARDAFSELTRLFAGAGARRATIQLPAPRGDVRFEQVSLLTASRDRAALTNISCEIAAGQFIGVIGPSGAGKSSLLRLLAGAAAPDQGVIRIDGASVADWDSERLARYVGFLPQEFLLFSGTIRDNISRFRGYLGEDAAEVDSEVIRAAQAAGAHEMILRLPNGYATRVGLGGSGLSAGQTQRVALARALYGDPRILILDEPNAHLDADGEQALVAALENLRDAGSTIIVAAHRGGVLANADKLMLINSGQIELFGALSDVATAMRATQLQTGAGAEPPSRAQRA